MNIFRSPGLIFVCLGAGVLTLFVLIGHSLGTYVYGLMDLQRLAYNAVMQDGFMVIIVIAYVVLIALPFVPGAEIGLALLLVFGPPIAGVLYLATVTALVLSFLVGRLVPKNLLAKTLTKLGANHTAWLPSENHGGDHVAKVMPVRNRCGQYVNRSVHWLFQHRLCALAALINTPGNTLIGGGGGISIVAGVSRKISFREFVICISLAVAPVPVIVTIAAWVGS